MITFLLSTLRRDLQQRLVFRWSVLFEIGGTAASLFVFFLIDRYQGVLFGDRLAQATAQLGTSYFGYVSLGLAVAALAQAGLGSVPGQFLTERAHRTLEYLVASPTGVYRWAVVSGLCNLVHALIQFATIFCVAALILKLKIPSFQVHTAALVLLAATVPLWCLSTLTLSCLLIFRRANPFDFVLATAFELLGGVYAPTSVLPSWLSRCGELLPITPAVRAMQSVVYRGAGLAEVAPDLKHLLILTMIYLPFSLWLLGFADTHARRKGHYCLS